MEAGEIDKCVRGQEEVGNDGRDDIEIPYGEKKDIQIGKPFIKHFNFKTAEEIYLLVVFTAWQEKKHEDN